MAEDLEVRRVGVDEIEAGELPKGSFIIVRWMDASDTRARLVAHRAAAASHRNKPVATA